MHRRRCLPMVFAAMLAALPVEPGHGAEPAARPDARAQARLWFEGKASSLVPIAISEKEKGRCDIRDVQASVADFVWGVPEEDAPLYPTPGFSTRWVQTDNNFSLQNILIALFRDFHERLDN